MRRKRTAERFYLIQGFVPALWETRTVAFEKELERKTLEFMGKRGQVVPNTLERRVAYQPQFDLINVRFTALVVPNFTERRKRMTRKIKTLIVGAAVAVGLSSCAWQNQHWHTDCTVTHKDVFTNVSGSNGDTHTSREWRVSTTCGAFVVESGIIQGFDSFDTWNALQENHTYDIKTGGYRAGFISLFPVVLEVIAK